MPSYVHVLYVGPHVQSKTLTLIYDMVGGLDVDPFY